MSIVETATALARQQSADRVLDVTVRIGQLATIHEDALRYSFGLARTATPLAQSSLTVIPVPVHIWCPSCERDRELPSIQRFVCPACGTPSGDIRAGRELEIESITLDTPDTEMSDGRTENS